MSVLSLADSQDETRLLYGNANVSMETSLPSSRGQPQNFVPIQPDRCLDGNIILMAFRHAIGAATKAHRGTNAANGPSISRLLRP